MPRNLYMCTQANFASVNKIEVELRSFRSTFTFSRGLDHMLPLFYLCTSIHRPLEIISLLKIKVVIVLTSMQSKLLHCRGLGLFICLNVS